MDIKMSFSEFWPLVQSKPAFRSPKTKLWEKLIFQNSVFDVFMWKSQTEVSHNDHNLDLNMAIVHKKYKHMAAG